MTKEELIQRLVNEIKICNESDGYSISEEKRLQYIKNKPKYYKLLTKLVS